MGSYRGLAAADSPPASPSSSLLSLFDDCKRSQRSSSLSPCFPFSWGGLGGMVWSGSVPGDKQFSVLSRHPRF